MEVAEMRMLRWSMGVTRLDKVRNEVTRGKMRVREMGEKITASRLRWFGHIERREEDYCGKVVDRLELKGKRKRGKPHLRWNDRMADDLKRIGATRNDAQERETWRRLICMPDPT